MSASKDVSTSSSDPTPSTSAPALLRVPTTPTMLLKDGTPTPDRLVRDLEESGLLQDFTRSHNPFDETFRRAAAAARSKMEAETTTAEEKAVPATGDTLNTPQILASLDTPTIISSLLSRQASTTSTTVAAVPRQQTASTALSSSFVAIAPAKQQVAAQLLLKLPSGDAIHLSDMPVIKQGVGERHVESPMSRRISSSASQRASSTRKPRVSGGDAQGNSSGGGDDDEKVRQLKERNRMAAHRSREKKKVMNSEMHRQIRALKASNANLSTENYILRQEVARLKAMLRLQTDCPSTVESGEETIVPDEIQPRVVDKATPPAMKSAPEPAPKVRIVQVNPFDVAQDMIIPTDTSAVALNLSKETRTVTVVEDEQRDILEEAARQIDEPDGQERTPRDEGTEEEQQQAIGGQPSYIRVTPNSISVKKTKVSSQSKKRTRSGSKKKS